MVDTHARPTTDQSVEVMMPLEVDSVFNQQCLQIPDLMIGNVLPLCQQDLACHVQITHKFHKLQYSE
jgi:hypothetical protein